MRPRIRKNAAKVMKSYSAFETAQPAREFERYLRTGTGHAFAKRHLGLVS